MRMAQMGGPPDGGAEVGPDRVAYQDETWRSAEVLTARAAALLAGSLNETQRQDLEQHQWFEVVGSLGNRYRIHKGASRNIVQLGPDGTVVRALCAAPRDVPEADAMLAQKLLIEADELAFAFIARTWRPEPPGPLYGEAQEELALAG